MLNQTLANASISTTNLTNSLKRINREKERPSEKLEIVQQYQSCQQLKKNVQRYIEHIESEQWLGSLIRAHEELTLALDMYQAYDKPIEQDSDSEDEWGEEPSRSNDLADRTARMGFRDDSPPPPMPPRPMDRAKSTEYDDEEEEEDPDDPFGNQYQITDVPGYEEEIRPGMKW